MLDVRVGKIKRLWQRLDRLKGVFSVQSEVDSDVYYCECDGNVAITDGDVHVMLEKELWQELAEFLNERNWTRYRKRA